MANLLRLAEVLIDSSSLEEIERLLRERQAVLDHMDDLLADAGFDLVIRHSSVVTISRSSAVEAVLAGAFNRGWEGGTVVLDGTSAGCGPVQAERLERVGLSVRSLPDGAMLGAFQSPSSETLVLVGADAVGPNRIVNAQGTALLLEASKRRGVHTAVVADTGKEVEDSVIDELLEVGRIHRENGPARAWPVFEAVSRDLVGERVSERGRLQESKPSPDVPVPGSEQEGNQPSAAEFDVRCGG